jgi:hypothetical protein
MTIKIEVTGEKVVSHCAWCEPVKDILTNHPEWKGLPITSGICPACMLKLMSESPKGK